MRRLLDTRQPTMNREYASITNAWVGEARPGRNIGDVGNPKTVRTVGLEATINQIGRSGRAVIGDGRALGFASDHAF